MKDATFLPKNAVVKALRAEYAPWIKGLSPKERHAIKKYSLNSHETYSLPFYKRVNAAARNSYDGEDKNRLLEYVDIISTALKRQPVKSHFICYRGVDNNIAEGTEIGETIYADQFMSTSVLKSRTFKRKYLLVIYVYPGTHGAYIEKASALRYQYQREFLLDKDCAFKLISVSKNIIKLEVRT